MAEDREEYKYIPSKYRDSGITEDDIQNDFGLIEKLQDIVPFGMCEEAVKKYREKFDEEYKDKLFIEDCDDPEEYEKSLLEDLERDLEEDRMDEHAEKASREMITAFKGLVGKTLGDIADLENLESVDELLREFEDDVDTLISELVRAWINTLWFAFEDRLEQDGAPERVWLGSNFLPCFVSPKDVFGNDRLSGFGDCEKWEDVIALCMGGNCQATDDDKKEVFKVFARNIVKEIEKNGKILLPLKMVVRKSKYIYFLEKAE